MHLRLPLPADAPLAPGKTWTPELGSAFLTARDAFLAYLGLPTQAITYKLGEHAWLTGKDRAHAACEDRFDLVTEVECLLVVLHGQVEPAELVVHHAKPVQRDCLMTRDRLQGRSLRVQPYS
jgi:hypothetical protein